MDGKVIGTVAEFHKDSHGKLWLFSLWVRTEEVSRHDGKAYFGSDGYDVEWSKSYGGYVFHNSSSGFHVPIVSGIYFIDGDIKVKERPCAFIGRVARKRNRTRMLRRIPRSFDMSEASNLLEWLQQNAKESDTVYCSKCRDHLPTDEEWMLCEHIWWCENKLDWSTPDERCACKSREECDDRA